MPRVLLGCHALAWRAGGSLLSSLRFHCGTKGLALCGVLLPSTPLWNVVAWFCAAVLRYSSLMFQAPLWTSAKASKYRLWSFYARSPSVLCCLPAPCLLSCVGCSCVRVLLLPPPLCPLCLFWLLWLLWLCVLFWLLSVLGLCFALGSALSVLRFATFVLNSFGLSWRY